MYQNSIGQSTERGRMLQRPQLQLPTQSSDNVTHYAHNHGKYDPAILDFRLQDTHNLVRIKAAVQGPEYSDSTTKGNQKLYYVTQYFFQLFLNLSDKKKYCCTFVWRKGKFFL